MFSHCLCNRLIEFMSNKISFWQELLFNLITEIDDLKHLSTKMYVAFTDFADTFGSVSHKFIFDSLDRFNIPETYCNLIKDPYKHSCFQVIGRTKLSKVFYIICGTKTGNPSSAIIFIIVIDCIFNPMISVALVTQNIENEKMLNPLPIQGFADYIAIVTHIITWNDKRFRTCHAESKLGCESIEMCCFIWQNIREQLVYRQK